MVGALSVKGPSTLALEEIPLWVVSSFLRRKVEDIQCEKGLREGVLRKSPLVK